MAGKKRPGGIPARTIERMVLYKRLLSDLQGKGRKMIYSHELAALAHNTAAQVRRDFMEIGHVGIPRRGYDLERLLGHISGVLNTAQERYTVLVGIGNLGHAILSYFTNRHPGLRIVAAFDNDPAKVNRNISGCPCYPMEMLKEKVEETGASIGIITVPASQAQLSADMMVEAGLKGILNFAPVPLKLPEHICEDRIDIATSLEKLAYYVELTDSKK